MSLIDLYDPEVEARKKIEKLFLDPKFNEGDRHRIIKQLTEQQYKLGMPFHRKVTEIEALSALHPIPAQVAALQVKEKLEAGLRSTVSERDEIEARLSALQTLEIWAQAVTKPFTLERNDCSRLHKLKEAGLRKRIIDGDKKKSLSELSESFLKMEHTFVVKHDWARAFEGAEVANEFILPYEMCCFEFRMQDRSIILWAIELEGKKNFTVFIECSDYWYCPPQLAADDWMCFLWDQVKAICVALDAEVATSTVIRAPHKLNEKRTRDGKLPLLDYRVVDLSRRHRVANPSGAHEGGRKRLHFRRGHWRHYETSKTWVRWCLVGNPDLGFIQKHYSL